MAVRSRRLALGRIVTPNVQTVVYTVPADRTAVVRSIWLQNDGATTPEVILSARNSDTNTVVRLALWPAMARHDPFILDPWCVLEENDDLRIQTTATNDIGYWISGALLLGDPA